jgi:cardiolipin synthase A/B
MTPHPPTDAPASGPATVAARLAQDLPGPDMDALGDAAIQGATAVRRLGARASAPVLRGACDEVLALLAVSPAPFVAGALLGAACGVRAERRRQTVDVVWTGPPSAVTTSRLTSAVVVELIDSANEELLLVSFATNSEPTVGAALHRASGRGVSITLLLERPSDNPNYTGDADPFPDLPAGRLAWPGSHRPAGAAIHAKIIVVDRWTALVGSANLTGRAMDRNLECGVLIRGGAQPAQIRDHLVSLVDRGFLRTT